MNNFELLCIFSLTLSLTCGILNVVSLYFAIKANIAIKAVEKSTHNIEYVPIDPNWATPDKKIDEINERSQMTFGETDPEDEDFEQIDLRRMI